MKKRKDKRILRKVAVILVIGYVSVLLCGAVRESRTLEKVYCVQNGDALWKIAAEYKPDNMRYWEYISLIYQRNPKLTPNIHPGDQIVIPYWEE